MGLQLHLRLSICSAEKRVIGDITVCLREGGAATSPKWAAANENSFYKTLIRRIAAGDQSAMRALFARYRVRVYRWLLRLVDDESLAENLLSEVFLDLWRHAASFEARSSVSSRFIHS
jgi:hypothetical protein